MANIYDFTVTDIDGSATALRDYQGKLLLIVNVASQCGLTPQYAGLQELYDTYRERGFVVLGFPCNQFGGQEPGSEGEIKQFCETRFGVNFPMFGKVEVNGPGRAPLFTYLTGEAAGPDGPGDVQWNFAKFLVGRDGRLLARFAPTQKPVSEEVVAAIESHL